jgi:hypothetical protein
MAGRTLAMLCAPHCFVPTTQVKWQLGTTEKDFLPRVGGSISGIDTVPADPAKCVVTQTNNTVRLMDWAIAKVRLMERISSVQDVSRCTTYIPRPHTVPVSSSSSLTADWPGNRRPVLVVVLRRQSKHWVGWGASGTGMSSSICLLCITCCQACGCSALSPNFDPDP